jgi:RNA polymerase sigma-70 factor (ECF subfamily)
MTASSPDSVSTSSSLLRRAKAEDAAAWARLCELYGPLVYRWARQAGLQATDAADVGQEVFRVVSRRLASFRREKYGDAFRGWLWGITRNKIREHRRQEFCGAQGAGGTAALQRLMELAPSQTRNSSESEKNTDRNRIIRRTLEVVRAEFEESTWQAFWRSAVDNQRASEIANELGISTAAVRQAKYRVLRRLRNELADLL